MPIGGSKHRWEDIIKMDEAYLYPPMRLHGVVVKHNDNFKVWKGTFLLDWGEWSASTAGLGHHQLFEKGLEGVFMVMKQKPRVYSLNPVRDRQFAQGSNPDYGTEGAGHALGINSRSHDSPNWTTSTALPLFRKTLGPFPSVEFGNVRTGGAVRDTGIVDCLDEVSVMLFATKVEVSLYG